MKNQFLKFTLYLVIFISTPPLYSYKGGRTQPPTCKSLKLPTQAEVCREKPTSPNRCYECAAKVRGFCIEDYKNMPKEVGFNLNPNILQKYKDIKNKKVEDVKVVTQFGLNEKGHPFVLGKYTDPDSKTCADLTVNGGETICDVGYLTGLYHKDIEDDVLIFISTFERPIFAKCNYFNPNCGTCCPEYHEVPCPPPPTPTPPSP